VQIADDFVQMFTLLTILFINVYRIFDFFSNVYCIYDFIPMFIVVTILFQCLGAVVVVVVW